MCRGKTDRADLGFKKTQKLIKDMKPRQHRQSLTSLVKDVDEDDILVYLYGCANQGQWLKSVMQVDTSWMRLLYEWTPELLSFHLNAVHDQLPSPANLRLWGKTNLGSCQLCQNSNCILFHILNGCNYSLQSERYNWRHDQTLETITSGLMPFIDQSNEREYCTQDTSYIPTIAFRTADGTAYRNPAIPLPKKENTNILQKANDWEVLMDEEQRQIVFPPQMAESQTSWYQNLLRKDANSNHNRTDCSNGGESVKCIYQEKVLIRQLIVRLGSCDRPLSSMILHVPACSSSANSAQWTQVLGACWVI